MEKLVCANCGRTIEPSTDIEHYEDTGMLCDVCLAHELDIQDAEIAEAKKDRAWAEASASEDCIR